MKIAPTALMDDGELDLCLVKKVSRLEVLSVLPKVFSGKHVTHPKVSMHRFKTLELSAESPAMIWADGQAICKTPAVIQVMPKALRVLAP